MELSALGFDQWFRDAFDAAGRPDCTAARVTAVHRDRYLVRNEKGEVPAEAAGGFVYAVRSSEDLPAVGDWALVRYHDAGAHAIIHGLLPRRSFLQRKTPGRTIEHQMIAANIDEALIVQGCDGDFNLRRLERYLVMVNEGGIVPVVLLTKSDLVGREELEELTAAAQRSCLGCQVLPVSTVTGFGLDEVRRLLAPGKTYCMVGSSGVGKTTLLNRIIGRDLFETNTVRRGDGKGRHTTTERHLVVLDAGAMLIDTPGMRELGNIGAAAGIEESFSDIAHLVKDCRFADCTHTREAGCALLEAVERGAVPRDRYQSYLKLLKESAFNELSYAEKRRRDRDFGKFIKTALQEHKKRRP